MKYLILPEIEKYLVNYYENKKKIQLKEIYLIDLNNNLKTIQDNLSGYNITLNKDIKSIEYINEISKKGQFFCSNIDKQIEHIYSSLENKQKRLMDEIIIIQAEILKLNEDNRVMKSILDILSPIDKEFLELRYSKNESFDKIADKLFISKTTLRRKIIKILNQINKSISYFEKKQKIIET